MLKNKRKRRWTSRLDTRYLEIRRKSADNKGPIPFEGVKSFNKVKGGYSGERRGLISRNRNECKIAYISNDWIKRFIM